MSYMVTTPAFTVDEALWEARFATGAIGTSGAISKVKAGYVPDRHTSELLILFRSHYALVDGPLLVSVCMDLYDEIDELQQAIQVEIRRRLYPKRFCFGSIQSFCYRFHVDCQELILMKLIFFVACCRGVMPPFRIESSVVSPVRWAHWR